MCLYLYIIIKKKVQNQIQKLSLLKIDQTFLKNLQKQIVFKCYVVNLILIKLNKNNLSKKIFQTLNFKNHEDILNNNNNNNTTKLLNFELKLKWKPKIKTDFRIFIKKL